MWPDERDTDSDDVNGEVEATSDEPLNRIFDLLADRERRYALYYLDYGDGDVASFAELADYVVARNADSVADLEDDGAVAARLADAHLPTLERSGVVEYDPRSGDVRYRGSRLLERALALARRCERS